MGTEKRFIGAPDSIRCLRFRDCSSLLVAHLSEMLSRAFSARNAKAGMTTATLTPTLSPQGRGKGEGN